MRDHGGNLDDAQRRYGAGNWLDLSTGINARPYPVGQISAAAWAQLPTIEARTALEHAAARAYGAAPNQVVALSGAQNAIQLMPALAKTLYTGGGARVLSPTYNEHAAAFKNAGWQVDEPCDFQALEGAAAAVVVNPNNPDGRQHTAKDLVALAQKVGLLVVDESFADPEPPHRSLCSHMRGDEGPQNVVILRSFGKFYGLAGLRLGFAVARKALADQLRASLGPWPISGPAIEIASRAFADETWARETRTRLSADAARLDALVQNAAGWSLVGGTSLFRSYQTPDARAAQTSLARAHIWSRIFPYHDGWIRLGLPADEHGWSRLTQALARQGRPEG